MPEGREYWTVVLAGLLHDVGKFLQRGSRLSNRDGSHPEVSATFISSFAHEFAAIADTALLRELVLRHHRGHQFAGRRPDDAPDERTRVLATLVSHADSLSAKERGQHAAQWQDFRRTPLAPVFDRLFAGEAVQPRHRLNPVPLPAPARMNDFVFPEAWREYGPGELDQLLDAFGPRCRELLRRGGEAPAVIAHLLALLEQHTWAIASDTQETMPDISLFDHLKTTAALATCLYLVHEHRDTLTVRRLQTPETVEFCLLTGDFSGIQRYIFDIATGDDPGRGVARRLRARSFAIQALSDIVAASLVTAAGLSLANILVAAGGKFHLLLPNVPDVLTSLSRLAEEWDAWFADEYRGELSLNLVLQPFDRQMLDPGPGRGFGRILARADEQLQLRKAQRMAGRLVGQSRWREEAFLMMPLRDAPCTSCGKFERRREGLCGHCLADLEWGQLLPQAHLLALIDRPVAGWRQIGPRQWASLLDRPRLPADTRLVLALNPQELEQLLPVPAVARALVGHVPVMAGEGEPVVLTFEDLASRARGRPLLGFLKMDVDKLGETFAFGLQDSDSVSRIATLSRMLDLFFSRWIERLLERDYPDCYAVFSGGDDLFVIGPWDQTVRLARRIAADYARFTGQHPELGISGGLVIGDAHYPVGQAARAADHLVYDSKRVGGGRLTLLDHTVTWAQLDVVLEEFDALVEELPAVSQGFLHRLVDYGRMWQQGDLRLQPLLAYAISRETATPGFRQWANRFTGIRPLTERDQGVLDGLGLLAQLWIYAKGGGRRDEPRP